MAYNDGDKGKRYVLTDVAGVNTWVLCSDQRTVPTMITGWGTAAPGDYQGPWLWAEMAACFPLMKDQIYFGGEYDGNPGGFGWPGGIGYHYVGGYAQNFTGGNYTNDYHPYYNPATEGPGYGNNDMLGTVKAATLADYADTTGPGVTWFSHQAGIGAYSVLNIEQTTDDNLVGADDYSFGDGGVGRVRGELQYPPFQSAVKDVARSFTWYGWSSEQYDDNGTAYPTKETPYDALGDTIPPKDTLAIMGTVAATTAAVASVSLAAGIVFPPETAAPHWPAEANEFGVGAEADDYYTFGSYGIYGGWCVVRWSFTD